MAEEELGRLSAREEGYTGGFEATSKSNASVIDEL
jgi:hypothetical protein